MSPGFPVFCGVSPFIDVDHHRLQVALDGVLVAEQRSADFPSAVGKQPDFASMYQPADAVTGLPAAFWFEKIFEAFPHAKVVLTMRDNEEVWMRSWAKFRDVQTRPGGFLTNILLRGIQWFPKYRKDFYFINVFEVAAFGTVRTQSTLLLKKKYREHNLRVQDVIPKEKLLVYNVRQGWKPLCEFLGCNVPNQPFPRENVESSWIRELLQQIVDEGKFKLLVCIAFFLCLVTVCYLALEPLY